MLNAVFYGSKYFLRNYLTPPNGTAGSIRVTNPSLGCLLQLVQLVQLDIIFGYYG